MKIKISFFIPFKEILENEEKDIATSLYLVNHEKGKCYMISFGWSIGTMTKYNNKLNIELNLLQSIINIFEVNLDLDIITSISLNPFTQGYSNCYPNVGGDILEMETYKYGDGYCIRETIPLNEYGYNIWTISEADFYNIFEYE